MYYAHLHFEMRKNLKVGMDRSKFPRNDTSYYSPKDFISDHRTLRPETREADIPLEFNQGSRVYEGNLLSRIPAIPRKGHAPITKLNAELRSLLQKHGLLRSDSDNQEVPTPPRTAPREVKPKTEPELKEEQNQRDSIRDFWNRFQEEQL
mgnify:CR=1 FL=1